MRRMPFLEMMFTLGTTVAVMSMKVRLHHVGAPAVQMQMRACENLCR